MSSEEKNKNKEKEIASGQTAEQTKKEIDPMSSEKTDGETTDSSKEGSKKKIKIGHNVPSGIAYIHATFNNTKVSFTDLHGNVLCWGSGGKAGFKGSKKSTAYVAQIVATDVAKKAQVFGMQKCEVKIKGPGAGRESAVRGIAASGLEITVLQDITPVPHNGCRPPKRRRV
jgi:small subunit ribosomal protein S11